MHRLAIEEPRETESGFAPKGGLPRSSAATTAKPVRSVWYPVDPVYGPAPIDQPAGYKYWQYGN